MKNFLKNMLLAFAAAVTVGPTLATDLSRKPLAVHGAKAPNVIFGMDDSGSMDWEVLLPTRHGQFWWTDQKGWDASGKFVVDGVTRYSYLFPVGCSASADGGARNRFCNSNALPPTPQFASLRSSTYNPIYYNPKTTYRPWAPATVSGVEIVFPDAVGSKALLHPLFKNDTDVIDLRKTLDVTTDNWTFLASQGMVLPAGTRYLSGNVWNKLEAEKKVGDSPVTNLSYEVSVPYFPASYWNLESCVPDNVTCVNAPDSKTLKLYKIDGEKSFPSGRQYLDELQNFANWFTYYRSRKLMLAGSMGHVLNGLSGMRVGLTEFNNKSESKIAMYDTDITANSRVVAGKFYNNLAIVTGTPTRATLKYIGDQFDTDKSIIESACQRNAAFIVTDGYANDYDDDSVFPPAYDQQTYGSGAPYSPTTRGTLADTALAYYTRRLRPTLPEGLSPAAGKDDPIEADKNKNLHMNTYAITLGSKGTIWPDVVTNPYGPSAPSISWPTTGLKDEPGSIDDLWHATINGRGRMFLATNPAETSANIQAALNEIQRQSGSQGAVTFSTVNLKAGDSTAYVGSYSANGYSGELQAYSVDPATGKFADTPTWNAGKLLLTKDWSKRVMASFDGLKGIPFTANGVDPLLNNKGFTTTANAVDYFRGDRSLEASTLRVRTGIIGAVLTAEAVVDSTSGVVYLASGEGAVHAFDKSNGEELWAYVPGFVLADMGDQLSKTWKFETMLDATPQLAKVGEKRFLVGTRGSAGAGVYALDVTKPKELTSDSLLANAVAWEFPNIYTPAPTKDLVGALVAKPLVVNTPMGAVVVIASGYFPDKGGTGDGKARIFVLNATTGELKQTIVAPELPGDTGEAGLSALSGFLEADGTVRYVYGGDERGHLWRFDLKEGTASLLMTLADSSDKPLPITAAPELARINNRRMVFIGTGRFLGESDFNDSQRHSFFALWDDGTTIPNRNKLASRDIAVGADGVRTVSGSSVDWTSQRGWVITLPQREKAHTDPTMGAGIIVFTTNSPSLTECTAASALYVAEATSGLALPSTAYPTGVTPWYGRNLGSSLTSAAVLTRHSTGSMGITTRQSDGARDTRTLNMGRAPVPRKTAWRELLR